MYVKVFSHNLGLTRTGAALKRGSSFHATGTTEDRGGGQGGRFVNEKLTSIIEYFQFRFKHVIAHFLLPGCSSAYFAFSQQSRHVAMNGMQSSVAFDLWAGESS